MLHRVDSEWHRAYQEVARQGHTNAPRVVLRSRHQGEAQEARAEELEEDQEGEEEAIAVHDDIYEDVAVQPAPAG